MKRLNAILVLTALVICCFSCNKDPIDSNVGQIKVVQQSSLFVKDNDTISAELVAICEYSGTITRVAVQVGYAEDLSDAILVATTKTNDGYVASFPVQTDMVYYYRYIVYRYSVEFEQTTEWEDERIYSLSTHNLRLPSLTTNAVKFVSANYALGCGAVSDDGNEAVIERGFCWGTQLAPTIRDYYALDGDGIGNFYVEMKNLANGKEYYARAYARNNRGIVYGRPFGFRTQTVGSLAVETLDPTEVKEHSAKFKGNLVFSASGSLNNYGFLFGLTPNTSIVQPAFIGNYHHNGTTTYKKPFSLIVSTLENNTKYYVRAYSIIIGTNDTIFGEMKSVVTQTSPFAPIGELNGAFSVSPTQQVEFSPGNLQYQASTNKWRFAPQQWEFIGDNNKNISATYYGWIDLFGWGTSGYNHGAVCYQPWSSSSSYSNYYAYGSADYNLNDQTGLADWGSNTVYLGDNATEGWRTLTSGEWDYLINTRITQSGIRYAKAQLNIVNGTNYTSVNGMIVFPDDWIDNGLVFRPNIPEASYTSNIIFVSDVSDDWKEGYESKGAVFLPATGRRSGLYYYEDNQQRGYYWSTSKSNNQARLLYFFEDGLGASFVDFRYYGHNVRLVRDSN